MLQDKTKPTVRAGFFHPSSYDNGDYIHSLLDKVVDKVASISYIRYRNDILGQYCIERGIPSFSYPINAVFSLPSVITKMVESVDFIYILDNGFSSSVDKIKEACDKSGVKYKVYKVDNVFPVRYRSLFSKIENTIEKHGEITITKDSLSEALND
jgi:hypothetical protein